jgi:hypothetical protein
MHVKSGQCGELVEKTAAALNDDTAILMLLAVQRGNCQDPSRDLLHDVCDSRYYGSVVQWFSGCRGVSK